MQNNFHISKTFPLNIFHIAFPETFCIFATIKYRGNMGTYVNPGIENFEKDLNGKIHIDKSLLIKELNEIVETRDCYLCVSRPRRFGKTMAENMLCAYYGRTTDTSQIFDNMKIGKDAEAREKYLKYRNAFNVLIIDCLKIWNERWENETFMQCMKRVINQELISEFQSVELLEKDAVSVNILKIYNETKIKFVIFFDEYDLPVRLKFKEEEFQKYLDFLVSLFKTSAMSPAVALGYMTGILPVVRDKFQSKLNNFQPITMVDPLNYAEFTGFTKEEVRDLCAQYKMDYQACEEWYDGYRFRLWRNDNWEEVSIFNPNAIVRAMLSRKYSSYWSATGSYETISDYINFNFDGTKDAVTRMLSGEEVDVWIDSFCNSLNSFKSKDDVFGYLTHLGYLAYNEENQTCYIPNKEVANEWVLAIKDNKDYSQVFKTIENSKRLMQLTINGEEEAVAEALSNAQQFVTSPISYNNEQSMQSAINLAYFFASTQYYMFNELPAGKGYADVSFIPKRPGVPAIIIELKKQQSTGKALEQIMNKQYFKPFANYKGEVLLVAVNYDDEKNYTCKIEKWVK